MGERQPAVYILAGRRNGTLYVGVTSDLERRNWQHKNDAYSGFTHKYGVRRLACVELCKSIVDAFEREKQLKKWNRRWKLELIQPTNPAHK
jgi:putative endonuclease